MYYSEITTCAFHKNCKMFYIMYECQASDGGVVTIISCYKHY